MVAHRALSPSITMFVLLLLLRNLRQTARSYESHHSFLCRMAARLGFPNRRADCAHTPRKSLGGRRRRGARSRRPPDPPGTFNSETNTSPAWAFAIYHNL